MTCIYNSISLLLIIISTKTNEIQHTHKHTQFGVLTLKICSWFRLWDLAGHISMEMKDFVRKEIRKRVKSARIHMSQIVNCSISLSKNGSRFPKRTICMNGLPNRLLHWIELYSKHICQIIVESVYWIKEMISNSAMPTKLFWLEISSNKHFECFGRCAKR